ncbi:MAG: response regulator transcription factor [Anaerolineae bacterium]|nr:response regulator transcription factor [Anaerolineae bacterium]
MTISVVIVDDHPIVRAGMRAILNSAGDINILGEGVNGADALRLVVELRPDVLALDVQLPDLNGLEVTRQLRQKGSSTAVLILTAHDDSQTVFGLLQSGAVGYVLKDEALETLVSAVRVAARGETWLSPAVARQVVNRAVAGGPASHPAGIPKEVSALTARESEVLRLIARGLDNTAIAQELCLTKRTVQNHISNIYGKLGVSCRTEAALFAVHSGLG